VRMPLVASGFHRTLGAQVSHSIGFGNLVEFEFDDLHVFALSSGWTYLPQVVARFTEARRHPQPGY
jgi:hypothetical protein